ncbi:MAG: hypothetical protein OEV85_05845 [Candidatus Thorarchaeota archaeon]|nr:hypothetical protein [Candidatus Thorarchaeota archaeon]
MEIVDWWLSFLASIVSVLLLDGLALGLGAAFIIASLCGTYLTRGRPANITWSIGGILTIFAGTISGLAIYRFIELVTFWVGPAIQGLSGSDLIHWNYFVSTAFNNHQYSAIASSYIGSIAGIGMGYGIGIRPRDEATTFWMVLAVFSVFMSLTGFAFVVLEMLIAEHADVLYLFAGFSTAALVLFAFYQNWKAAPDSTNDHAIQEVSDL